MQAVLSPGSDDPADSVVLRVSVVDRDAIGASGRRLLVNSSASP